MKQVVISSSQRTSLSACDALGKTTVSIIFSDIYSSVKNQLPIALIALAY
ncbi:hypothetical protein [Acetivibrio cellulolyticus]|nr:hypothetical protein [Acetivibrio cellulolyticus]